MTDRLPCVTSSCNRLRAGGVCWVAAQTASKHKQKPIKYEETTRCPLRHLRPRHGSPGGRSKKGTQTDRRTKDASEGHAREIRREQGWKAGQRRARQDQRRG